MAIAIDDRLLKVRIRELSYEAAMAADRSHARYVRFFSEMVDATFSASAPEVKAMAVSIARTFDYAGSGEMTLSEAYSEFTPSPQPPHRGAADGYPPSGAH